MEEIRSSASRGGRRKMSILMLPWLAHGHISPFLELSKRLSDRDITIFFCSSPTNLNSIKQELSSTKYSNTILLVELHLPSSPELPPHFHTTKHLPPRLMPSLKAAFDHSARGFSTTLSLFWPDLVVYDFLQPWAPAVAMSQGIPAVEFLCTSAAMSACVISYLMNQKVDFPFPELYLNEHEVPGFIQMMEKSANGIKDRDKFKWCSERSAGIILIKSFREIEAKYIDYLSAMLTKKVVPVGPLVEEEGHQQYDRKDGQRGSEIIEWLDRKPEKSTVFVSFGSEYFLSEEEMNEIAYGLEQSRVNFIWVVRFHGGDQDQQMNVLPQGFLARVRDRGYVVEGWAPQIEILSHRSTGGFVSHCGWSSIMEAMRCGVPIIAMPMHLDQPINARLVAESVGVGMEVKRDKQGRIRRDEVERAVRSVVVERAGEGARTRRRAEEVRSLMVRRKESGEEDEEIDWALKEILQVCGKANLVLLEEEEENHTEMSHRVLVPN